MLGSRWVGSSWALSSCHHHHDHYCSIHLLIPSVLSHTTITTATTVVIIIVVMFIITIIIAVSICLSHLSAEPFSDRLSPLSAPDICFQSGSSATPSHPRLQTLYKANSLVSSVVIGNFKISSQQKKLKKSFFRTASLHTAPSPTFDFNLAPLQLHHPSAAFAHCCYCSSDIFFSLLMKQQHLFGQLGHYHLTFAFNMAPLQLRHRSTAFAHCHFLSL